MNAVRAKRGSHATNRKALWKKATTASLAIARFKGRGRAASPPPTLAEDVEVSRSAIAEWKEKRRRRRVSRLENTVGELRGDVNALKAEFAEFATEMRGMAANVKELCGRLEAL